MCFSFTDPGGRELIERKRKEKSVDQLGLSDPAPSYSQLANRQAGQQQPPTLCQAVMYLKKLV
jgi:hypothetical protein